MKMSEKEVLVVEDSKMFAHAISGEIRSKLGFKTHIATSCEEARVFFKQRGHSLLAAVLDLVLPDAPHGEVVEFALESGVSAIVLTGEFSEAVREEFSSRHIVDYIIKEGPHSIGQLINTLKRLDANGSSKVLVVDDSRTSRQTVRTLLARHHFVVIESGSGKEALSILEKHPDVRLVITDFNMPGMDGFELTTNIRKNHPMDRMAIIGISGSGGSMMSARFLKHGANDFIVKPFSHEEFFLRVNQNMQMLDYIESIRYAAIKDHLTGLYNRRYFFDMGSKLFENAKRKSFDIAMAMIDIDHFKRINDTYGHAIGDEVLRHVSGMISGHFRSSDVVARLGGEEFCVMAPNMSSDHCVRLFDSLRQDIQSTPLLTQEGNVTPTISIGLTTLMLDTLEQTLNRADELLYQAKNQGRNQVVSD